MNESATPLPAVSAQQAKNCTNPFATAAASIMRLEAPGHGQDTALKRKVEKAMANQALLVTRNDLSMVEAMLTAQVQVLHRMFAQAAERYADALTPDAARPFGNLALKAQNCCRNTVASIARIKKEAAQGRVIRHMATFHEKSWNELVSGAGNEALDTRRTSTPGATNPHSATLEESGR